MSDDQVLNKLMKTSTVRNLGLKEERVKEILDTYHKVLLDELLDNGHVELSNGMNLEIVRLTERVHVLRGIAYSNQRKYKLKLTMMDELYEQVEKYYDDLQEIIG